MKSFISCYSRRSAVPCAVFFCAITVTLSAQAHPMLLPEPQQITYGNGQVDICRKQLAIDSKELSLDEDRFALMELKKTLSLACAHRPGTSAGSLQVRLVDLKQGAALPQDGEKPGKDSREAYRIFINEKGILLEGKSSASLFYAVQTVRQLLETSPEQHSLPFIEIQDWPAMPYRGFMMDMSHGAVQTMPEVERQIDLLARFKVNQYYWYSETGFIQNEPLLQYGSSWSREQIAHVIEYARQRHIDVIPCIELYGHLHDVLRLEKYASLAAVPHGGEIDPTALEVQPLLESWVRQIAALFPSPWIHLGFDEPFELERSDVPNKAKKKPEDLWLDHLHATSRLAASLNKRPLFWADIDEGAYIFNRYPELADHLPGNAIAVPWFYAARGDYSNLMQPFVQHHIPSIVATGIADWEEVTTDFATSFINIDGFVLAGRKAGSLGMVNTVWSDSALPLHRTAEPAMVYGAAAAWQSMPMDRTHFFENYASLFFPQTIAPDIATALSALGRAQTSLQKALGQETAFRMWDDPLTPAALAHTANHLEELHNCRLAAEEAETNLIKAIKLQGNGTDPAGNLEGWLFAAQTLDYVGLRYQSAHEIAAMFAALPDHPSLDDLEYRLGREVSARNHSRVGDLFDLSGKLKDEYKQQWLEQYRPFRLESALARWSAEQEYWRSFQQRTWAAMHPFKQGDPSPTLESIRAQH
ncbi:beta-N-acetylhexosaminidase [Edaphobacter flagellatus]|uniref:beta-N-acetylhexosaminidase n=1 Tax=Edaphobacter flagellatus TaxID=1933044 RepID=UPI0021B261E6|nr:beta-N-acetylhexosaminidase [Edaphobacter flagellatus]